MKRITFAVRDPRLGVGPVRLFVCDCDGVLVDSEASGNEFIARYLTDLGYPTTEEEAMTSYVGRAISSVRDLVEQRFHTTLPVTFVDDCSAAETAAVLPTLRSFDGIERALDTIEAAGIGLIVASGGTVAKMRATLGHTGLLARFDPWLVSSEDVGPGKPAPDVFLAAAHARGVPAEQCVAIEDSLPGLQAARAAGMAVIGFTSHLSADELLAGGANVVVDSWDQVPPLLGA